MKGLVILGLESVRSSQTECRMPLLTLLRLQKQKDF